MIERIVDHDKTGLCNPIESSLQFFPSFSHCPSGGLQDQNALEGARNMSGAMWFISEQEVMREARLWEHFNCGRLLFSNR